MNKISGKLLGMFSSHCKNMVDLRAITICIPYLLDIILNNKKSTERTKTKILEDVSYKNRLYPFPVNSKRKFTLLLAYPSIASHTLKEIYSIRYFSRGDRGIAGHFFYSHKTAIKLSFSPNVKVAC